MTKLLFFLGVLLFSFTTLFAQNPKANTGIIQGTIVTNDGKPAACVTIKIDRSRRGAVSNEKGEYTIRHVMPGTWVLKTSAVAITAQQKEITVVAGQTLQ